MLQWPNGGNHSLIRSLCCLAVRSATAQEGSWSPRRPDNPLNSLATVSQEQRKSWSTACQKPLSISRSTSDNFCLRDSCETPSDTLARRLRGFPCRIASWNLSIDYSCRGCRRASASRWSWIDSLLISSRTASGIVEQDPPKPLPNNSQTESDLANRAASRPPSTAIFRLPRRCHRDGHGRGYWE